MINFNEKLRPLEKRPYRFKNPAMEFFCPLCRTPRAMNSRPRLSKMNYMQIALLTLVTSTLLYPFMELAGVFSFFFIWVAFEATVRLNFRKDVPCPYCGFDASWYKRDVKVARRLVKDFWESKQVPPQQNGQNTQTELR